MSTQAEIDLEARIGDLERQIAELSAKVNPLYSGGMDRYIHSGYLQWDGINLRFDKNAIQIPANGVNRTVLYFLQALTTDPSSVLRKSQLIGNVSDSAANIIMASGTSGVSVSGAVQANASSFLAYWTASMGGSVYQLDFQASSGSDWGLLTLTKGYLRIVGESSDPAGVADGSIWYNTADDKLKARINGVTVELGGGFSDAAISFTIDGGGAAIATGQKGHIEVPFDMTVTGWTIVADQSGSIVVDVWKDTYANFPPTVADTIAGSEKPTLSSAQKNQDLSLSSWATTLTKGDILAFNVDSASTVTRVTVSIRGTRT